MGLFSFFNKELAIDLGTANTVIIYNDKVVVDEPSIVAIQRDRMLALELQQLLIEEIVIAVADYGAGLHIVQPVVPFDLRPEKLNPILYTISAHYIPLHHL